MIKRILFKIIFVLVLFSASISFAVQHDFILPDNKGGELWADISQGMKALATQNSGPNDPANPQVLHSIFTGTGIDDAISGGTFSASSKTILGLQIDASGTPDTFQWRKNSGAWTTGVAITGSAQTITDGITVTFTATTGHTLGDKWFVIGLPGSTIPFQFWADTTTGTLKQRNKDNSRWVVKDDFSDVITYTKLLLHADGAGNLFTDSSVSSNTITAHGNVTQSTTKSKFGGKSAFFDGTGDYLSVGNTGDFHNVAGEDFTYDFWINFNRVNARQGIVASGTLYDDIEIELRPNNKILVHFRKLDGTGFYVKSVKNDFTVGVWYHIAVTRESGNLKIYIDGQLNATSTGNYNGAIQNRDGLFLLGRYGSKFLNGYIDEFRYSKGVARWTANFTPPGRPYN